jgi:hypothetical protein
MRRFVVLAALLATGCTGSGFARYEADTFSFPWNNPNEPTGGTENFARARHGIKNANQPLLTEAGDIWPGPPMLVPTLKDLQKQQMAEINNQGGTVDTGLAPLPALPSLPGYEISPQEAPHPTPTHVFQSGSVAVPGGRTVPLGGAESYKEVNPGANGMPGAIVVPNGNGTSTVIGPTGNVTTIPTPPK